MLMKYFQVRCILFIHNCWLVRLSQGFLFSGSYCSNFQYIWATYVFGWWACCQQFCCSGQSLTYFIMHDSWLVHWVFLIVIITHMFTYPSGYLCRLFANNHWLCMVMVNKHEASNTSLIWYGCPFSILFSCVVISCFFLGSLSRCPLLHFPLGLLHVMKNSLKNLCCKPGTINHMIFSFLLNFRPWAESQQTLYISFVRIWTS